MPYVITLRSQGATRIYRERSLGKALETFIPLAQRPEPRDKQERIAALAAFQNAIVKGLAESDYFLTAVIDERVRNTPKNVALPKAATLSIRRKPDDDTTPAPTKRKGKALIPADDPGHTEPAPSSIAHLVPTLPKAPASHQAKKYLHRINSGLTSHVSFDV